MSSVRDGKCKHVTVIIHTLCVEKCDKNILALISHVKMNPYIRLMHKSGQMNVCKPKRGFQSSSSVG